MAARFYDDDVLQSSGHPPHGWAAILAYNEPELARSGSRLSEGPRVGITASVIFLVVCAALTIGLGDQYVWTKDEARPGLVVKEMLATGRWSIPHIGGRVYADKPPLFHWLVALVSPRGLTAFTLRFPSVVAAASTASVTYLIGAEALSPAAGLVAAAALVSSPSFYEWARTGRMEMLLTLWITLAFWSFLRWLAHGRRADALLFGLWVGLGVLTKGPAALIPVAAGALALPCLRGRWPGRVRDLGLGLTLSTLVVVAWVAMAWLFAPDFAQYVAQSLPTFVEEMRTRPRRPFGYGLKVIAVGFLPWSLVLPVAAVLLRRSFRQARQPLLPILLWIAVLVLVFSVAIHPRPAYFLPIYPALALLLGYSCHAITGRGLLWLAAPLGVAFTGFAAAGLAISLAPRSILVHDIVEPLPAWVGVATVAIATIVLAGGLRLVASQPVWATVLAASGALALLLLLDAAIRTPGVNHSFPMPRWSQRLMSHLPADAEMIYTDFGRATALLFYLPHPARETRTPEDIPELLRRRPHRYALLTESQAQSLRDGCGSTLRQVDRVEIEHVAYVLAALREPRPSTSHPGLTGCLPSAEGAETHREEPR